MNFYEIFIYFVQTMNFQEISKTFHISVGTFMRINKNWIYIDLSITLKLDGSLNTSFKFLFDVDFIALVGPLEDNFIEINFYIRFVDRRSMGFIPEENFKIKFSFLRIIYSFKRHFTGLCKTPIL